ncbi:1-acyl-sn-glycerol-3-phosphate acyltransferase [Novosphingobium marinum]|uniref:1-acyl-sn-glycerol-3-phosphate acyltransferase n=1 Tax=Novosphingobium marinum TaxID=1514948 RepID=A0A7Z0BU64_9SPHN|nr:lysophospholipid acyltransferase family protein [Novosphingobium marinum]NYH94848.1 1-acyl-sn-glycerol-3-phosphate acyltransferase [Novosphingobium marinum]GGC36913.1 1-acyl-sn-glycerol-3-phosphate acyltransferase [Novosphingobium marinum]
MARAVEVFRSLAFYAAFYIGTAVYVGAALATLPFSRGGFIRVVDGWSHFHRWCVIHVLGIRVEIEGEVPDSGVLVAIKHESFFEAIDLPTALNHPVVFAKAELLRIPFWGRAGGAYGLIPVERNQGASALRAMIKKARALTAEGRPLAIFPEGTRVAHGERPELRSGFAGTYKLLGLPVVPVAVDSGPLYHRRWKKRGTITYRVGEPIPAGLPRPELEGRVIEAINSLNSP